MKTFDTYPTFFFVITKILQKKTGISDAKIHFLNQSYNFLIYSKYRELE